MQNSESKMARFAESTFGRQDAEGELFFWTDRPILDFRFGILDLAEESANTPKESTFWGEVEVGFGGKAGMAEVFDERKWEVGDFTTKASSAKDTEDRRRHRETKVK